MATLRAVRQSIFTVIAKVDALRVDGLVAYLDQLNKTLMHQDALPFADFNMLHFCSFTVFHDDRYGPYLAFESNVDGKPSDYIDRLCMIAAPALHTIYGYCADYVGQAGAPDCAYLGRYLREHIVRPKTSFVGNLGRSAQRIKDEATLVAHIQDFLDRYDDIEEPAPERIYSDVRYYVGCDARWSWTLGVPPRLPPLELLSRCAVVAILLTALVLSLPLMLLGAPWFIVALRWREKTDPVDIARPPVSHIEVLLSRENQIVQNHMASLCYVKPGAFRRRMLKIVLFLANVVARLSTQGELVGLTSLHFAHWSLIDNDTRLLFLTNYDGSWENYLDDFIEKAAVGLTAIWSNTLNFPRTSFLVCGGARDERKFKAVSRTTQAYTNLWYSAYPTLTVTAIENNSAICNALAKPLNSAQADAWLRRF